MIQKTDNVLFSIYSDPDLDTNKVINQKYFYFDKKVSLDILNSFENMLECYNLFLIELQKLEINKEDIKDYKK
jgi:hypothetical protein